MPKGVHLSKEQRLVVHHNCIVRGLQVKEVHHLLFAGDNELFSLESLHILVAKLKRMSDSEIARYLCGPVSRKLTGRPRKFDSATTEALCTLRKSRNLLSLSQLLRTFKDHFVANDEEDVKLPSKSTLTRIFKRERITRKITVRKNVNASAELQYAYLQKIAAFDPGVLVDIDETLSTQKEFERKYGWSPEGEEAIQYQIRVADRAFSTIAAYTVKGFIAWAIYEGSVTSTEVQHFLTYRLQPALMQDNVGVLDNATVHKTADCQDTLEYCFRGLYVFCPPYSPELKPIEKGFSCIKRFIRENEAQAILDPISWINKAFFLYSRDGERCDAGEFNSALYLRISAQFNSHFLFGCLNNLI